MPDTKLQIKFQCPYCEGSEYTIKDNKVHCMTGPDGLGMDCDNTWTRAEAYECFVLIRRFISKLDFGFYQEHVEDIFKKAKPNES